MLEKHFWNKKFIDGNAFLL